VHIPEGCITGRFVSEDKNRFLCTVEIDGAKETCYIASSCRLDNFINLRGKTVLLKPTEGKFASTNYAVFAVKHKRNYILLNTSFANKAVENAMYNRKMSMLGKRIDVKREFTVENYKTDFYIPNSNTIVEVKSVISVKDKAQFPTVYSERALKQLQIIEGLLQNGYAAHLVIVSLNPYVKEIEIYKNTEFYEFLSRCVACGLMVEAFSCKLMDDGNATIWKKIPLHYA